MDGEPGVIHDDIPGVTIQGCDKADTSLCSDIPLNQLKKETSHSHGDKWLVKPVWCQAWTWLYSLEVTPFPLADTLQYEGRS